MLCNVLEAGCAFVPFQLSNRIRPGRGLAGFAHVIGGFVAPGYTHTRVFASTLALMFYLAKLMDDIILREVYTGLVFYCFVLITGKIKITSTSNHSIHLREERHA